MQPSSLKCLIAVGKTPAMQPVSRCKLERFSLFNWHFWSGATSAKLVLIHRAPIGVSSIQHPYNLSWMKILQRHVLELQSPYFYLMEPSDSMNSKLDSSHLKFYDPRLNLYAKKALHLQQFGRDRDNFNHNSDWDTTGLTRIQFIASPDQT